MLKLISASLLAIALFAKDPVQPIYQDKGLAIKGYDPVAYFTDKAPKKGDPNFSLEWMGAKWLFTNAEHRDMFKASPEKYAPQFGGYCSFAVSKNTTAGISPNAWDIVDDKLYLNAALAHGLWKNNIPGNIKKGQENWPKIEKLAVTK